MEHYYECPISVLCCVSPKCRKDILDKMTHKQVEMWRKTLSFRRWADLFFYVSVDDHKMLSLLVDKII